MRQSRFVGCIDIHDGRVKQIVGSTLSDDGAALRTNFVAKHDAAYYARLYKKYNVLHSHVIKLGPNCDEAAISALQEWPDHLQIGGGITAENAQLWLAKGASKVIVTSYLFPGGTLDKERLRALSTATGRERLVIDLSCRRVQDGWVVAMDRWQRLTEFALSKENLEYLAQFCSEFLVHAADVEGLCQGVDDDLIRFLTEFSPLPVVYAGGARSVVDLMHVNKISYGSVDLTYGSSLDIFGGSVRFLDLVELNSEGYDNDNA